MSLDFVLTRLGLVRLGFGLDWTVLVCFSLAWRGSAWLALAEVGLVSFVSLSVRCKKNWMQRLNQGGMVESSGRPKHEWLVGNANGLGWPGNGPRNYPETIWERALGMVQG